MGYKKPMKISLVIPHVPVTDDHHRILMRCIESMKGWDELIVLSDMGEAGFTKKVNDGIRMATGDYIMVVNNDVQWMNGDLKSLCIENTVTSPVLLNTSGEMSEQYFWGCFFVIPRKVLEKVGYLDEQFFLYCSDTDYVRRLKNEGIECRSISSCVIFTEGARTTCMMKDREELDKKDTEKFVDKWGLLPSQIL